MYIHMGIIPSLCLEKSVESNQVSPKCPTVLLGIHKNTLIMKRLKLNLTLQRFAQEWLSVTA